MNRQIISLLCILFLVSACSGAETVVKKNWVNKENTLVLQDLTPSDLTFKDSGPALMNALEDSLLANTSFVLSTDEGQYQLKYKILEYTRGSRGLRLATMGLLESAKSKLTVKVALYNKGKLVGGWAVESWLKDGLRSEDALFKEAADDIVSHLRGGY
jgi:hypothetical protein